MGQYWNLICMDKEQATGHLGKMGELLFRHTPDKLVDILTTGVFQTLTSLLLQASGGTGKSPMEGMLPEIQLRICSFLGSMDDLLCLALSSCHFLDAVPQYLMILEEAVVAPWAGKRIICIGDYADDLPGDFLTDREKAMILNSLLYRYADRFTWLSSTSETNVGYCLCAYMYLMGSNLSAGMKKELRSMCSTPLIDPVLRNLTTKEYVRSTAVPSDINFGHILLLKICWTSDPSMSLGYRGDEDFHRRAWAGHRFDIVSPEWVDSTWKDVSDVVVPKIAAIFRAG